FVRPRVSPCTSSLRLPLSSVPFFSFPDTPTTETYTLSLHDALPIWDMLNNDPTEEDAERARAMLRDLGEHPLHELTTPVLAEMLDRKSTRLNSSHVKISYAVFCLKKKKRKEKRAQDTDQQSERVA